MKTRKITLVVAAAAIALATASPALAGSVIPSVTVDTSGVPSCGGGLPCATLGGNHTGTFSGIYTPTNAVWNDTQDSGTCEDGNSQAPQACEFKFRTGDPATLCTPNTGTPWSTDWVYRADASQANEYGGKALYAEGGGIIDFTGTNLTTNGVTVTTRVHIEISGLCGHEADAQGLANGITATSGIGTLDLSDAYKFSGYIDITPTS